MQTVRARPRYASYNHGTYVRPSAEQRRLHPNARTHDYLQCLANGAAVVDPGDLDMATEIELHNRVAAGELTCGLDHGRRVWRRV